MKSSETVLVIGASVGSSAFISQMRADGFDGRITVIDGDPDAPYDRPPLSKQFLLAQDDACPGAPWWDDRCELIRASAIGLSLDPSKVDAVNADGSPLALTADHIVIATGSVPVRLPGQAEEVVELRTAADARGIRDRITKGSRVAILGAGTVGTELASSLTSAGCSVTVIDMGRNPLDRFLGGHLGEEVASWMRDAGVELMLGAAVEKIVKTDNGWQVTSSLGSTDADMVISAIGTRPAVGWLDRTDIDVRDGVRCDRNGTVLTRAGIPVPRLHALGDVAAWQSSTQEGARRYEDWTTAQRQGRHLAKFMNGDEDLAPFDSEKHYFWSHQFGRRIQVLGTPDRTASLRHHADAPGKGQFYTIETATETAAWIAINSPVVFARAMKEAASVAR